ncbi:MULTISPECIES: OmpA family protein [Asticcacaulis]|uniref:OmpA family protein n=1 Tax=Asticcacaulis TaxID=76890 RepID=UPI001AEB9C81|nr:MULTISPECIES: OmpA family protein [Asticcacaulis]MBP2160077.1 outer membrane protein OmpA-like peptidoglycan-associated protein/opacity protein-like surface antigen [Asticcacaulis solisilvae]MDR6801122.1 outer membrane protein OmpA-like peptidoglycan-associated protein/opacity protein-like surface antigen [Asticcacaulis sp. BE141]
MKLKLLAGTAMTLAGAALAHTASADTHIGWYAAVEAGQTPGATQTLDITDVTLQGTASSSSVTPLGDEASLKIDRGAAGFARLGYQFTPNLRAEAEFGTRPGAITDGLSGESNPGIGKVDKASAMVNLIYDIRPDLPLHPFVGIGAGVVQAKTTYSGPSSTNGHARTYSVSSEQTVPAAQVLAGASWRLTKRLNFDMIYRFMRTGNTSYDVAVTDTHTPPNASGPVIDTYTAKAAGHFSDHSLSVGLRWSFGAPVKSRPSSVASAPAAPLSQANAGVPNALSVNPAPVAQASSPAPVPSAPVAVAALPAPAGPAAPTNSAASDAQPPVMAIPAPSQYTVYFPLNSLRLNAAAQSVITTAAQYAKSAPAPKLTVTGHADTSGSAAYNMALSRKRANVVAGGLKAEGIPSSAITVRWKGEKDLAVKTRDGVANAKNRRTTIDVSF